jgi:hypothetical protein
MRGENPSLKRHALNLEWQAPNRPFLACNGFDLKLIQDGDYVYNISLHKASIKNFSFRLSATAYVCLKIQLHACKGAEKNTSIQLRKEVTSIEISLTQIQVSLEKRQRCCSKPSRKLQRKALRINGKIYSRLQLS